MKRILIAIAAARLLGTVGIVAFAQGTGSATPSKQCGAGMKYDSKAKKCVSATPKGSGPG